MKPLEWLSHRFELSRGDEGQNVRPMEGLRGFAVFLVFLVHYVTFIKPWLAADSRLYTFADALHAIGNTGVDLFFVLSGYLIYGSLISRPQKFVRFMARRVQRIYPAFAVVFLLYVVLSFALPSRSRIPSTALEGTVYLVQNFLLLPGLFPIEPMITVAWSLSYEMLFYLTIPLVIAILDLPRRSVAWRVGFFLAVSTTIAIYCAVRGGHVRLIMFISGMLLFEIMRNRRIRAPRDRTALALLATGLLATLLPLTGPGGHTLKVVTLYCCFFALCFSCFSRPAGWLARIFSWTPLRWLGNMSYSYYLLHGLALHASFLVLGRIFPVAEHDPVLFWTLLPVMFLLTLPPTAGLFLLVERPFSLAPRRARTGAGTARQDGGSEATSATAPAVHRTP